MPAVEQYEQAAASEIFVWCQGLFHSPRAALGASFAKPAYHLVTFPQQYARRTR